MALRTRAGMSLGARGNARTVSGYEAIRPMRAGGLSTLAGRAAARVVGGWWLLADRWFRRRDL